MRVFFQTAAEVGRITTGQLATRKGERQGVFNLYCPTTRERLFVVVSDGSDWHQEKLPGLPWEHVSVSVKDRCPTWEEMCWVKSLFFEPEETVVEFHPPQSRYVNRYPYTLHLWRPVGVELPLPPIECV